MCERRSRKNARYGPHSPGFDARTSKVLAEDRNVLGVGVETIGTDAGQAGRFDSPFPNHATMHGADESLAAAGIEFPVSPG